MYSFLLKIVKCINIKIYIIIKIVILSMSNILISGHNKDFDPLQKPGYKLYTMTDDEQPGTIKYKIINKSYKVANYYITISDSVIFNNIYSHEINENDIPLVEYYNLLIEAKTPPVADPAAAAPASAVVAPAGAAAAADDAAVPADAAAVPADAAAAAAAAAVPADAADPAATATPPPSPTTTPPPSPTNTHTQSPHPITDKYAWDCTDEQITRFNGYYDMNYDRIKKDIFEYNKNTNLNIKFYIFQKEEEKNNISKKVTIIILKTSDNKIDPIIVTSSEAFLKDNIEKLENKIIAKISTTADTTDTTETTNVDGDTYILFNVDIIEAIKDAEIYKEEDKYKYDFVKLNDDLKKIIEYYNTISKLSYFITYSKIEKQLNNFKEAYNKSDKDIDELIKIYKEELRLRINICDNILASSSIDNNIKKYKDLLDYTYKNIDTYVATPNKKNEYIERIIKCVPLLIDRVRYYGKNFIY